MVRNDQFDFENAVTVHLGEVLYVIKYLPSLRVVKYSGVMDPESMTVTEFHDYAQIGAKPKSMMFRACAHGNGSILITGGMTTQGEYSREATRLDLRDNDEIAWLKLPDN